MNPKSNFLSMLNSSNATSPFSVGTKKKPTASTVGLAPLTSAQASMHSAFKTSPGPTAPTPTPTASPAKATYQQNLGQSDPYAGIRSSLEGIQTGLSGLQNQQPQQPKADPQSGYRSAMEAYISSLNPSAEESDARNKFMGMYSDIEGSQNQYAKDIAELGRVGAGAVAGNLSTGTNVVGSGNANLAANAVSSRIGALGDAQNARLQGANLKSDAMSQYLQSLTGDRESRSQGLLARAEYEKSLQDQYAPQKIGDKLVRQNPETGAYEEVYSPTETPEGFNLSEGTSRYEFDPESGQYKEIASKGKTYAPGSGTGTGTGIPKLGVAQQEQIATMDTVVDLANQVLNKGDDLPGVGAFGQGSVGGFTASKFGFGGGGDAGQQNRNLVGNIQATIAKMRGGTSFTANEEKLLQRYTPTVNDSDKVVRQKLSDLISFVNTLKKNTISVATGESFGTGAPQNVQEVNGYTYTQGPDGNWYLQE